MLHQPSYHIHLVPQTKSGSKTDVFLHFSGDVGVFACVLWQEVLVLETPLPRMNLSVRPEASQKV